MQNHRFQNAVDAKQFLLGGNAIFTVVSKTTGARFTFKIRKPNQGPTAPHFVGVMTGPDNEKSYSYMGAIFSERDFRHGKKSVLREETLESKAFQWVWNSLKTDKLPPSVEVWHEGRCCRCGRTLTVPESIEKGVGPECAKSFP